MNQHRPPNSLSPEHNLNDFLLDDIRYLLHLHNYQMHLFQVSRFTHLYRYSELVFIAEHLHVIAVLGARPHTPHGEEVVLEMIGELQNFDLNFLF